MKRILVYAPGRDYLRESSFRLRLVALQQPLARRGYQLDLLPRPATPVRRLLLARAARHYHAVILHRKWLDGYEVRMLRRSLPAPGKIIMDIDDATMFHETDLGGVARRRLERRFAVTCAALDLACVGNDYLAGIFREKGVATRIVPTVVDPKRYGVKRHAMTAELRIVWLGSKSTLKYLEQFLPAIARAKDQVPGLRLVVMSDVPSKTETGLPVEFVPWTLEGEAAALLQGDIGIAPTPEDRWTLGKCGFKIVQYMAAGLPVIASPVGANVGLVEAGTSNARAGLLAAGPDDWATAIKALAHDVNIRTQMGAAGRARVEAELNLEKAADAWVDVLG